MYWARDLFRSRIRGFLRQWRKYGMGGEQLHCRLKAHANGRNKSQHCCMLLGVFWPQCCVRLHGPKSLTGFKLYATSTNIVVVPCKRTQHVGSNNYARFWPQCCVRLHGPKSLTGFKLYATSANIVVVPCKRTQHEKLAFIWNDCLWPVRHFCENVVNVPAGKLAGWASHDRAL